MLVEQILNDFNNSLGSPVVSTQELISLIEKVRHLGCNDVAAQMWVSLNEARN